MEQDNWLTICANSFDLSLNYLPVISSGINVSFMAVDFNFIFMAHSKA